VRKLSYTLLKFNDLFNLAIEIFMHKYKIGYNEASNNKQSFLKIFKQ